MQGAGVRVPEVDLNKKVSKQQPRHTDELKTGGVPREQNILKGHLPRVMYHQVYRYS